MTSNNETIPEQERIAPFTPPRFEIDDPKSVEYLQEHGYVVFKEVAGYYKILELLNYCNRDLWFFNCNLHDSRTWNHWMGDRTSGIIYGLQHSKFMWEARIASQKVFESLWGHLQKAGIITADVNVRQLITSFDNMGIMRNSSNPNWETVRQWFHVDYEENPGPLYQGFLNLLDSDEHHGGLAVIPGSHKLTEEHLRNGGSQKYWNSDQRLPSNWSAPVKINCCSGDFVIWDHRTYHCNTSAYQPIPSHKLKMPSRRQITVPERIVAYITMIPLGLVPESEREELIKKRYMASVKNCATGHNVYKCTMITVATNIISSYCNLIDGKILETAE
jgi:hypothetical protein